MKQGFLKLLTQEFLNILLNRKRTINTRNDENFNATQVVDNQYNTKYFPYL